LIRGDTVANPILAPGDPAPNFTSQLHDGTSFQSADLKGQRTVLYFYPRDNTPGCTTQACDFRDNLARIESELGLRVIGVSPDSEKSHINFKAKHELPFPLIADTDKSVAESFGVWREKKNYGRTYNGIVRSTFVIGADGVIEKIYDNCRAKGHVDKLLRELA